jgi:hypothetical protein
MGRDVKQVARGGMVSRWQGGGMPDRSIQAQRPLQLTGVNMERASVHSCCAVLSVVLAVMCICVIYKFLSLGL